MPQPPAWAPSQCVDLVSKLDFGRVDRAYNRSPLYLANGSSRLVVDQRRRSTLPNARVGVGAELQDRTDSGIRISVTEDLLDRRERVLTAAVAGCDPLNFVGIV